jgi:DNA-binding beta-propeller fold protein YncE
VANAEDATVTLLDPASGRVMGPPLPAGPAPEQVVWGSGESLLVASSSSRRSVELTAVTRTDGGWRARSVDLAPGRARQVLIAGDGGPRAVVAYHLLTDENGATAGPLQAPCRLALVDVPSGVVEHTHNLCGAGELVKGLAVGGSPAGTTAYAGIQRLAPSSSVGASRATSFGEPPSTSLSLDRPGARPSTALRAGSTGSAGGRVVAIHAETGAVLATGHVAGVPAQVVLAPAPGGLGQRLYVVDAEPGPEGDYAGSGRWRLVGLNPLSLDVESEFALGFLPNRLVVTADGDQAYALAQPNDTVRQIDLPHGTQRVLATLPGTGLGLAVAGDRIYVSNPYGREVWALDRRQGRLLQTIPVGVHPVAIGVRGAP